jgi:hypothetical protein
MPDLEPVKIYLRQFDSGMNELHISPDQSGMTMLISQHIGFKIFQHHIQTLAMSILSDATVASKCSMFLVNQDNYVELKTPSDNKLGLVEDPSLKSSLRELGVIEGSHIVLVHNTNYCLNTSSEKQRKMRQINDFVANLYNLPLNL